jgi:hypothetical protein
VPEDGRSVVNEQGPTMAAREVAAPLELERREREREERE